VAKEEPKQIKRTRSAVSCYKRVFSTEDGHAVLLDLMKTHKIMESNFHENPRIHALQEGERNVILRILKLLNYDVRKLETRIEEANKTDPFWGTNQ
jgi:hypothetical protein